MRASTGLCLASLLLLAAGCGDPVVGDPICQPTCPQGFHCTTDGCAPDNPGDLRDLAVPAGDLAPTCAQACSGATPHCNANRVCAACLVDSHCQTGQICKTAGLTSVCVPGCNDDSRCAAGTRCCGGGCIDVSKDAQNCGACGKVCSGQNASARCAGGVCAPGTCNAGWGDCNNDPGDGCETSLRVDPANCTACGMACTFKNAVAACADGCYLAACSFGFDDCNGEEKDGCETAVSSDPKNCGGCGLACPMVPHAKNACVNASCALTGCDNGFSDCNGNPKDGCEVGTGSDVKNCGMCGNVCGQGLACINSSCTCQQCNIPNARTKCVNLQCVFDACLPGFSNCNNNLGDGCEVDLSMDPKNCGACGVVCPNNMPACVGAVCSNAGKCSDVATAYCKSKGWVVAAWQNAFPNQPGGSIYCVIPGSSAAADCDKCDRYNQLVWRNGARDACNSPMVLMPGKAYGGHNPCSCQANNYDCGEWPMLGCIPD